MEASVHVAEAGSSVPSAQYISISSVPDLIMLFVLVTESVNHAKVVPRSITKQRRSAIALVRSALLVCVFLITIPPKNIIPSINTIMDS